MWGSCACPRGSKPRPPHGTQANRTADRTSTRPPPFPTSTPCPYRTGGAHHSRFWLAKFIRTKANVSRHCSIQLAKFIRTGLCALPHSRSPCNIILTGHPQGASLLKEQHMDFTEGVLKRRMVRHFTSEAVAPEVIERILELAPPMFPRHRSNAVSKPAASISTTRNGKLTNAYHR